MRKKEISHNQAQSIKRKDSLVQTLIDPKLHGWLVGRAAQEGVSVAAWLRKLILGVYAEETFGLEETFERNNLGRVDPESFGKPEGVVARQVYCGKCGAEGVNTFSHDCLRSLRARQEVLEKKFKALETEVFNLESSFDPNGHKATAAGIQRKKSDKDG